MGNKTIKQTADLIFDNSGDIILQVFHDDELIWGQLYSGRAQDLAQDLLAIKDDPKEILTWDATIYADRADSYEEIEYNQRYNRGEWLGTCTIEDMMYVLLHTDVNDETIDYPRRELASEIQKKKRSRNKATKTTKQGERKMKTKSKKINEIGLNEKFIMINTDTADVQIVELCDGGRSGGAKHDIYISYLDAIDECDVDSYNYDVVVCNNKDIERALISA